MIRIAFSFLLAATAVLGTATAADEKPDNAPPAKAAEKTTPAFKSDPDLKVEPADKAETPQKAEPVPEKKEEPPAQPEKTESPGKGGKKTEAHEPGHRVVYLTLPKAIRFALAKNFSLKAEQFGPRIAKENVRSAWGRFDPLLDVTVQHGTNTVRDQLQLDALSGQVQRFGVGTTAQDDAVSVGVSGVTTWGMTYSVGLTARRTHTGVLNSIGDLFSHELSLNLSQPLLRGAGREVNLAGVRTAQNNVRISQWALKDRIMSVITDVVVVYNDLQFTKENLRVARESQALAQQLLEDNIKKERAGVMVQLDVTEARSGVATREEAVIQAERDVKDQENFLKQLITDDLIPLLGTDVEIVPPTTPDFYANVIAGVGEALELRPDYRQAKLNIENRRITVAVQKNALLPRLDLTASLSLLGIGDDFADSIGRITQRDEHNWGAGAIFSYPIGNQDALGRFNAATLEAAQALVQLEQLEQNIIVLVDNANGAVVTAKKRIDAAGEARRLAKESVDASEKKYKAGTGTIFEVLQLQDQLAVAQTSELRAKADYNQAVARYQQQIGTTLRVRQVTAVGEEADTKTTKTVRKKK